MKTKFKGKHTLQWNGMHESYTESAILKQVVK
jgi:hypothetical protein